MRQRSLLSALVLSLLLFPLTAQGGEFTEWMPRHLFKEFLDAKEKKGEEGKNFWDQGHWIQAVECKWELGWQMYRISIAESPKGKAVWWMWYLDMDEEYFEDRLTDLSKDGFRLVMVNKSVNPNGKKIFAATWQKIVKNRLQPSTSTDPNAPSVKVPVNEVDDVDHVLREIEIRKLLGESKPAEPKDKDAELKDKLLSSLADELKRLSEQNSQLSKRIKALETPATPADTEPSSAKIDLAPKP